MSIVHVDSSNFHDEVLDSRLPVLVDFWAPWCGPCRMFSPVLDQVAQENPDQVKIAKINVDEEPELAGQFGVMSIPTLVLVRQGQVVSQSVGAVSKQQVEAMFR